MSEHSLFCVRPFSVFYSVSACFFCCQPLLQDAAMQLVFSKGLSALTVQDVEDLLTRLGLRRFVPNFKKMDVREFCFVVLCPSASGRMIAYTCRSLVTTFKACTSKKCARYPRTAPRLSANCWCRGSKTYKQFLRSRRGFECYFVHANMINRSVVHTLRLGLGCRTRPTVPVFSASSTRGSPGSSGRSWTLHCTQETR